jgi:hypothetical protein
MSNLLQEKETHNKLNEESFEDKKEYSEYNNLFLGNFIDNNKKEDTSEDRKNSESSGIKGTPINNHKKSQVYDPDAIIEDSEDHTDFDNEIIVGKYINIKY